MIRRVALVALAALALTAAPAAAAPSEADLEQQFMCVECGTALSVSQSPVAERERALIRKDLAAGKSVAEIKADMVDAYGPDVLAQPSGGGFDAVAWIVPVVLVLLAAAALLMAARRWRRAPATPEPAPPPLDPADARRLDADLGTFDG
ncbi:MAG TPA: cytochrome c-type biogenesis protein CcmH [Solirubrobacteraceae bacterium]|jgi:cytochrome c-type biogenesis protein CcmH